MRVMGIDPGFRRVGVSTRCAAGGLASGVIHNTREDYLDGIYYTACEVCDWMEDYKPDVVAIEGMAFGKFGASDSLMKLAETTGVLKYVIYGYGVPVIIVTVSQWRSIAGRETRGLKKVTASERSKYLAAVKKMHGVTLSNLDEADAMMIMLSVEMVARGEVENDNLRAKIQAAVGRLDNELF